MATLQRLNGRFILQWRDALGQHKKVIGRVGVLHEKEAGRILRAKQYELDTGKSVLGDAPGPFFDDFVKEYAKWHSGEFPDSHYRVQQIIDDHLTEAFGNLRLDEITPLDVENWKRDRRGKVKSASIVKELRTLNEILNRAVGWRVIQRNPIEGVDPPKILDSKPKRFYTGPEVEELLKQHSSSIWRLFVNTGLRRKYYRLPEFFYNITNGILHLFEFCF